VVTEVVVTEVVDTGTVVEYSGLIVPGDNIGISFEPTSLYVIPLYSISSGKVIV